MNPVIFVFAAFGILVALVCVFYFLSDFIKKRREGKSWKSRLAVKERFDTVMDRELTTYYKAAGSGTDVTQATVKNAIWNFIVSEKMVK